MSDERLFAVAYASFGGLATLLAAIGLFGLASYTVTRRTVEIGVRMALGAPSTGIAWMVLRQSLVLVADHRQQCPAYRSLRGRDGRVDLRA